MNSNTTMLQLFQEFEQATVTVKELKDAMESFKRSPDLCSVSYTANDDSVITNEVFTVKSAGGYTVSGEGLGKVSWCVREPKQLTVLYEGELDDTAVSEVMLLTSGDVVYLHASADSGEAETVTLQQVTTFFEEVVGKLDRTSQQIEYLNSRIDNLILAAESNGEAEKE